MEDKVLVTGGAGFGGSHVADASLEAGWEVTVLDDLSTGRREMVPTAARFVQADVRSPEARQLLATGGFTPPQHHTAQKDLRRPPAHPGVGRPADASGVVHPLEGGRGGGARRGGVAASRGRGYAAG